MFFDQFANAVNAASAYFAKRKIEVDPAKFRPQLAPQGQGIAEWGIEL